MLILSMLLRITKWTQEELANYVGISRASINMWLKDDSSMSNNSKQIIAEKFGFPVSFFDIDLDEDLNIYKVVFSTIYESWKKINTNFFVSSKEDKINKILNEIEAEYKPSIINDYDLSDNEILDSLIVGCNPFTGEVFDDNHILNNERVSKIIKDLAANHKFTTKIISKYELNKEQRELFEELRKWRRNKQREEGFFSAYMVFNDQELINIVLEKINKIEDLRRVKGIGSIKYDKYAEEVYKILIEGKYNEPDLFFEFRDAVSINDPFEEFGKDISMEDSFLD